MLKIAKGKLVYDPTRGAKESTLLYIVAFRIAHEAIRRTHPERQALQEDEKGQLVFSPMRVAYLRPLLPWL